MDDANNRRSRVRGASSLGWTLLIALVFAVSVAISLAVQTEASNPPTPPPAPVPCGGLYTECCLDWDDDWGPCVAPCDDDARFDNARFDNARFDEDAPREGLFDAEENFANRQLPSRC